MCIRGVYITVNASFLLFYGAPGGAGKFIMMKKMIGLSVVTALLVIGAAAYQEAQVQEVQGKKPTADRHKDRGVTCGACHDGEADPKTAASSESCFTCKNHGSWGIVIERISANKEYKFNPHQNHITTANDLECTLCHQAHTADIMICHNCHQGLEFK